MKSNIKVIALHGAYGSGKDVVGAAISDLLRERGITCYNKKFGSAVKRCVWALTGEPMKVVDDKSYDWPVFDYTREQKALELPGLDTTIGGLLQTFATDVVRKQVHPDTWIHVLKAELESKDFGNEIGDVPTAVIITDLRFPNEEMWLESIGAIKVKVKRPFMDKVDELLNDGRSREHLSEQDLLDIDFDHILVNDSSIEALEDKAYKLASTLEWED